MKLKEHIERFEEALLEEKTNNPIKNTGILQEHICMWIGQAYSIRSI